MSDTEVLCIRRRGIGTLALETVRIPGSVVYCTGKGGYLLTGISFQDRHGFPFRYVWSYVNDGHYRPDSVRSDDSQRIRSELRSKWRTKKIIHRHSAKYCERTGRNTYVMDQLKDELKAEMNSAMSGETSSGKSGKKGSMRTVLALGLALAAILCIFLIAGRDTIRDGAFQSNYIKLLDSSTREGKIAEMLSESMPLLYKFDVSDDYTYAELSVHEFVKGKEAGDQSSGDLRHFMEDEGHEGLIALMPYMTSNNEIMMVLATDTSKASTGVEIDTGSEGDENDEEYSSAFTGQADGIIKVKEGEEIPVGAMYLNGESSDGVSTGIAETYEETVSMIEDAGADRVYLFTVKYGKD